MDKQKYFLRSKEIKERAAKAVLSAPDGYVVEIKPATRSLEQNARLWAHLGEVSEQVEWYGQKLSPEDWKTMFTASLKKSRVVPSLDPGGFVVMGLQTSKMTKAEMSALMELIEAFGAEHDVVFSDPTYSQYEAAQSR